MGERLGFRQPTVGEAVDNLCRPSHSNAFRKESIQYYRDKYGDQFADEVRTQALHKLKTTIRK